MEASAKSPRKKPDSDGLVRTIVDHPSNSPVEFTPIQWIVVQGWARGATLASLARKLENHICPHESDPYKRRKKTRKRIRDWLGTAKFRDAIWNEAQMLLDLESPAIMRGVARKAKAGRVDAARLAFELNGRHSPHTEIQPAQITIAFGKVPRPSTTVPALEDPDLVEGEVEELEDD
jgi:hypothetical protein